MKISNTPNARKTDEETSEKSPKKLSFKERRRRQKERDEQVMTFSNKHEKEKSKRKRNIMIAIAALGMTASLITVIVNVIVGQNSMAQHSSLSNAPAQDSAAQEILKGKKAVSISDKTQEKKQSKAMSAAVSSAKKEDADTIAQDIKDGKLYTASKHKKLVDEATQEQAETDKKDAEKLQDKLSDVEKKLKTQQEDAEAGSKLASQYKKQIASLNEQIDSLQKQNKKLLQQTQSSSTSSIKNKNSESKK